MICLAAYFKERNDPLIDLLTNELRWLFFFVSRIYLNLYTCGIEKIPKLLLYIFQQNIDTCRKLFLFCFALQSICLITYYCTYYYI